MSTPKTLTLNVVVYQDGDCWVAHCFELDVNASHPDRKKAVNDVHRVIGAQIEYALRHDPHLSNLFRPRRTDLVAIMASAPRHAPIEVKLNMAGPEVKVYEVAA